MSEKNFTLGDNVEHFTIEDVARDNPDFGRCCGPENTPRSW